MNKQFALQAKFFRLASAGLASVALLLAGLSVAQNVVAPIALEQTAPALPADEANAAPGENQPSTTDAPAAVEQTAGKTNTTSVVEDYTEKIGNGLKERERRLTLLNEAMMKLREAGEMEDAGRVEERIRGLLAMPAPSQMNAQLKSELEQLRA